MTQIKGTDTALMLAFEESGSYNGTITTPVGYLMPFDTCGVVATQNTTENNTILATRHKSKPSRGNMNVAGPVVGLLGPKSAGVWLKALLGDHAKTGSGPFTHDFTAADDVPSFALEKDLGSKLATKRYEYIGGAKISSLDISLTQEGRQSVTVNVVAAGHVFNNDTMDAAATDYRLDEPWDGMELFIKEGGAEVGIVTSGNITIANDLDEGSGYTIPKESEKEKAGMRQALTAGQFGVSGSLTYLLTDLAFIEKGANFTESSIEIKLTRGDGSGTAGNEQLIMTLPKVVYERTSPEVSGPVGLQASANFMGFEGFTAQLKNGEDL